MNDFIRGACLDCNLRLFFLSFINEVLLEVVMGKKSLGLGSLSYFLCSLWKIGC